jgi:hypothetical protein
MVCIYGTKRRRTKANRHTTITSFAEAGETVSSPTMTNRRCTSKSSHPSVSSRLHRQGRAGQFAAHSSAENALLNNRPTPNRRVSADQPFALTSNTTIGI